MARKKKNKEEKKKNKEEKNKKEKPKGFMLLLPFKNLMVKALGNKKIPFQNKIEDISLKFFNHIVKGQNFEQYYDIDNFESLDPATITILVQAIVGFIKNRKDKLDEKKKKGEATEEDIKELGRINGVEKGYDKFKKEQTSFAIGEIFTDYWYIWLGILVLFFAKK